MPTLKLLEMRKARGISQLALSEKSNVSHGYISELENNLKMPTIETICKLAKALDCKPEELFSCDKD